MTENTALKFAALVGIDWADRKHDICLHVTETGEREFSVLEHGPETIDEWANALRVRFANRPVAVCLEQRKGALITALRKYEHLVLFPVNPRLLAGLRRAFSPSGAKDDPTDAELAVDILQQHPDKLQAWTPYPPAADLGGGASALGGATGARDQPPDRKSQRVLPAGADLFRHPRHASGL